MSFITSLTQRNKVLKRNYEHDSLIISLKGLLLFSQETTIFAKDKR